MYWLVILQFSELKTACFTYSHGLIHLHKGLKRENESNCDKNSTSNSNSTPCRHTENMETQLNERAKQMCD